MASSPIPPPPKKLKMSSTTSSDNENPNPNPSSQPKARYKRRKIAIFLAYLGVGYQGMQKNPGAKTIESDLEDALFLSGAVPESDRSNPKRYDWARSARTDKGVSAIGQVVSGRFYIDPPGFVDRLNSYLSPQIRVFGYTRVTNSFNSKKFCDRRRYVYLLPVFALDPNSHPDRESVLASVGSGNVLVKCSECSERGRKVVGVMGRRNPELDFSENKNLELNCSENENPGLDCSENKNPELKSSENKNPELKSSENENPGLKSSKSKNPELESSESENPKLESSEIKDPELKSSENNNVDDSPAVLYSEPAVVELEARVSDFCYGEKERERFNRILKHYVGTHNFHNFTTRTKAEDPSARRYILSFNADNIVLVEGMEFVRCEVVGQSFMLHQIRKMIGLAVAVMRNCTPESLIDTALRKDINLNVPTAPEVGLFLDECFFSSYNQKWKDSHEELSMEAYIEEAEDFKMKNVYPHIASMEQKDGVVALWLHSLNHRNYPDFHFIEGNEAGNDRECAQEENRTDSCLVVGNREDSCMVEDNGANTNGKFAEEESRANSCLVEANGAHTDGECAKEENMKILVDSARCG
ncbi:uncharacterized protein LOC143854866 isoform X2 [Tasmannia lanceolata]|uniref:uncharacterized protein LOC143854866 isoform X2 n=1 Tax=Tasmannia lanceolata TaxID=3420 RepID=UPI00406328BE